MLTTGITANTVLLTAGITGNTVSNGGLSLLRSNRRDWRARRQEVTFDNLVNMITVLLLINTKCDNK